VPPLGKTLNPSQPMTSSLLWPSTSKNNEKCMYFQNPLQVEQDYLKEDCDFFGSDWLQISVLLNKTFFYICSFFSNDFNL
jgi:hypothetical protein